MRVGTTLAIGLAVLIAVAVAKPSLLSGLFGRTTTHDTVIDGNHKDDGNSGQA